MKKSNQKKHTEHYWAVVIGRATKHYVPFFKIVADDLRQPRLYASKREALNDANEGIIHKEWRVVRVKVSECRQRAAAKRKGAKRV